MLGVVARGVRWNGRDAVVDHFDDRVGGHVEMHDQTFDRARVGVVRRFRVQERDATRDAPTFFALVTEHARGPGIDLHRVEVGDPALGQRGDVVRVLLGGHDRAHRLRDEQCRPHVGVVAPVDDLALGHRDDHLVQVHRRTRHNNHTHLPVDGVIRLPARQRLLLRLVQDHVREQRFLGHTTRRPQDLGRANDLVAGQHVERMGGAHDFPFCSRPLRFSALSR